MKKTARFIALLWVAIVLALAQPALASQGSGCMPTTGTVSGLTLVQDINAGIAALISSNSGATAPVTDCSLAAVKGQLWVDTSVTPNHLRIYSGAAWLDLGAIDTANGIWTPPVGGGTASIASATTTDLCSVPQSLITITSTTTINSFSNTCIAGTTKDIKFAGILTLTYNAGSMILPTAGSITTAVGDYARAAYLGGGNWAIVGYTRADGTSLSSSQVFIGAVFFNSPISPTVAGNSNDWNPTGLATANVIRVTCSSPFNITGLTAPATNGKIVALENVGATNNCTLTPNDTLSAAANRFAFTSPFILRPGRTISLKYDATAALWRPFGAITAQSIAGRYKNLRVFNVATRYGDSAPASPNSQVSIAVDELTIEDANGGVERLSAVSCTISASGNAFSAGSGGLDTGALAAPNWYTIWVIYNSTTNVVSCLASLSSTIGTITLPSGYTFAARVGWDYYLTFNASTGFQRIIQTADWACYVVTAATVTPWAPIISTGIAGTYSDTAPTWATPSVTTAVPSTASVIDLVIANSYNGGGPGNLIVAPSNTYAGRSSVQPPPFYLNSGVGADITGLMALEASTIAVAGNSVGNIVGARCWKDNL